MTCGSAGELSWQRGRCDGGACVEVAVQDEVVMMRSSVHPGTTLQISRDEWQRFLAGAKDGTLDEL